MEGVLYVCCIDLCIGDWLFKVIVNIDIEVVNLCLIQCSFDCYNKVFVDLLVDFVWMIFKVYGIWVKVCVVGDFVVFVGIFVDVIEFCCVEVVVLFGDGDVYDVLLNDYELGVIGVEIVVMFDVLCLGLVDLCEVVLVKLQLQGLSGLFDEEK